MEGFIFCTRASNGSIDSAPKDLDRRWSASDRARRVAQDGALHALLNAEIEKSGFLTSAGHRAVIQEFLYSDAVDREMANARVDPPQSRRFLRQVSTDGTACSTGGAKLSQVKRRRSTRSFFSLFSNSDSTMDVDVDALVDDDDRDRAERNIAPRRASKDFLSSFSDSIMDVDVDARIDDDDHDLRALDGHPDRTDGAPLQSHGASGDVRDSAARGRAADDGAEKRRRRPEGLPPVRVDGDDGAAVPPRADDGGQRSEDASYTYRDACADDMLSSMQRPCNSADDVPDLRQCSDVSGELRLPRTERTTEGNDGGEWSSDDDSCMDECGWLPWPEGKRDVCDSDPHMVSLESLQDELENLQDEASFWNGRVHH